MDKGSFSALKAARFRALLEAPLPRSYSNYVGNRILQFLQTLQGLLAFAMITLGVILTKLWTAQSATFPLIFRELRRSGLDLIPLFLFMSAALGFAVIGQSVTLLSKVGANSYLGLIMVAAVVRELGPLFAAMLVLSRSGTANVIELGTARSQGEVEALEALGIDPVHYLVMPRVIGMALGVFALTVYFIMGALLSGYLWAFIQKVPLEPHEYFQQLAASLTSFDFLILAVKSSFFGIAIAIITCYHGLARPLHLDEVSRATIGAVAQCIVACVVLDAIFIFVYLVL